MQQIARFWDRHARRYADSPIADIPSYEHKLQKTREYFHADTRILELGCGTGSTALLHASFVAHILATDVSAKMLEIAREKATALAIDNVSFKQAEACDVEIAEPVDMVMTMSLLHLLADKEALIKKIYCWLKPGGVFVSSTVCLADSRWRYIRYVAPLARKLGLMPLLKIFSEAELKGSLLSAGFEIDYCWKPQKGMAVFMVAKKPQVTSTSAGTALK
ncbi:class I SAM-dependent methyltransferase [Lacimicrobium alkaliphilum]|uniref:SAM-dependent methyltransferase n=1 Tax=Lacimicrobium alkaliphilum TaxID=1526571 RepID=A0A0U2JJZ0_9ALTE|nr:class I SAM-dependent methyltransferase [Lacimicrobium alkaliphilum]ALT00311.1 SAM-dependent methyltransferase [Lacimicrobium alkaliphilum]